MARTFRRIGSLAGACVLAGAFAAVPAHAADTPEVYLGSASGKGLDITVLGQSATFGASSAKVSSLLTAAATGAGQAVPQLLGSFKPSDASVSGNGGNVNKASTCVTPDISTLGPQVSSVLNLGLACSEAHASVIDGNPVATSAGSVALAKVDASTILNGPLAVVTSPLVSALTGLLTTVNANVPQPVQNLGVTTTLTQLLNALVTTNTLDATLGGSTSKVTTAAGTVSSVGEASAATIKLLPLGGLNNEPVATIQVSAAKATSTYDRLTGTSTASFDPAIVRVHFNTALISALPLGLSQDVVVPVGQSVTLFAGLPIESTITVGKGQIINNADGSVGAVADGVKLELLKNLSTPVGSGGVTVSLAHAEAGVAGALASSTPTNITKITTELPRTGGTPWIPLLGTGILGMAILVRRTSAKADPAA